MTVINAQNTGILTFKHYNPFAEIDVVKTVWLTLLNKCRHSYFVSWGWISTWINSLPEDTGIQLIVGYLKNEPVLAFFIGRDKQKRYMILPTRIMSLNATANPFFDEITIEHNSILFDPTALLYKESLYRYLRQLSWDEFTLPGISSEFVSDFKIFEVSTRHFYITIDRVSNSYYIELQKIRNSGMDYLHLLSAKKRSQIRRSIKQYETDGTIQIRQATNAEEALSMLDKLAFLHQQAWQNRGKEGSFSNKYFYQFHNELIRNRFSSNEVQLLHIFNDNTTIGYLYNFIYAGKILFYQSGYNYSMGKNYRPGDVSLYFAIMHNAKQNLSIYDFLAGDQEYKRSLATDSAPMYWARLIKAKNRYNIEMSIIKTKQKLKAYIQNQKTRK